MTVELYDPPLPPGYQLQDPSFALGGKSCTCFAGTWATLRNTFGDLLLPGRDIREATHDTVGGTSVHQVDDAIVSLGADDDLSTGWWNFERVDHALSNGKGFLAAIRYRGIHRYQRRLLAKLGHIPQENLIWGSELFGSDEDDWHAVLFHRWLAAGTTCLIHGKTLAAPPDERGLVVFDPLCNGRRSTVAKGAVVYPEALVRAIVADSLMANGKLYGALTLDARYEVDEEPDPHPDPDPEPEPPHHEPRRTLRYGGEPIHRRLTTVKPAFLRSSPRRSRKDPTHNRVRWVPRHTRFEAWQRTEHGTAVGRPGHRSRVWFGNRAGDLWISATRLEGF